VMYAGKHVESAPVKAIYGDPRHPYTKALLASLPRLDAVSKEKLVPIEGLPPDLIDMPPGCAFSPRCDYAIERCFHETPALRPVPETKDHHVSCWVEVKSAESMDRAREVGGWAAHGLDREALGGH
ncbi:MAG: hypothetical protein KJ734_15030, partial [Chloroflexi bacterium]|nr:hypothetical protein [Chloroflexota bacterium]